MSAGQNPKTFITYLDMSKPIEFFHGVTLAFLAFFMKASGLYFDMGRSQNLSHIKPWTTFGEMFKGHTKADLGLSWPCGLFTCENFTLENKLPRLLLLGTFYYWLLMKSRLCFNLCNKIVFFQCGNPVLLVQTCLILHQTWPNFFIILFGPK